MRISALDGRRVALWGWGREGRAAYRAIRTRLPALPLGVLCTPAEAGDVAALGDANLAIHTDVRAEVLAGFEVVVKSPGISPYSALAQAAWQQGVQYIGGSRLWFAEQSPDNRICCVTGTKGKSTTSSLLAHLLRQAGRRTALAGNIGLPLLELLDADAEEWVVELSSYQTRDVAESGVRPLLAIVTNIFPEHLDWHGSQARYVEDKLALLYGARPRHAVLNAGDALLRGLVLPGEITVHTYGDARGWHLRGDMLYRADDAVLDTTRLPLPGRHNRSNLCAVLTALEVLGIDAVALAAAAHGFSPLPHRLQVLGQRDGLTWVNDSISTTPHAALAAWEVYRDAKVVMLLGGHDRGLDWQAFAHHMAEGAPHGIVTLGANGEKIHALLAPLAAEKPFHLQRAGNLDEAVARARQMLDGEGVVLLSPGAPSFGAYPDYVARGRHFAELAGFDASIISALPGMGIA